MQKTERVTQPQLYLPELGLLLFEMISLLELYQQQVSQFVQEEHLHQLLATQSLRVEVMGVFHILGDHLMMDIPLQ